MAVCRSWPGRNGRRPPSGSSRLSVGKVGHGVRCRRRQTALVGWQTKNTLQPTYRSALLLPHTHINPPIPYNSHNRQSHTSAMPDVNTLPLHPRSPSISHRPRRISISDAASHGYGPPSPRSPSLSSLQAAATINAGLQRSPSSASPARNTGLERRRSSLMNNLSLNDPSVPAPGEMQTNSANGSPRMGRRSIAMGPTADPHHARQPSLGELHQELEAETEGQVNRLLHMIRIQQEQLTTLQRQNNNHAAGTTETSPTTSEFAGLPTPSSTASVPHSTAHPDHPSPRSGSNAGLPQSTGAFSRRPTLSRHSSSRLSNTGSSFATSPSLRPSSGGIGPLTEDFLLGGTRDESAFYQAETQMLTRENQMLKQRIRELGKLI